MAVTLIADSGATKAEWCLLNNGKKKVLFTQGISPYFLNTQQVTELVRKELVTKIRVPIDEVFFYGTGCANPKNAKSITNALATVFPGADITVNTDLMAAARA